jgi:hypothetical protein
MLTRDKPPGDTGVAQSLHDEHIQLARRQHERERLRGHPPRPLIKIDADSTSQNPQPRPEHHTSAARGMKCRNAGAQRTAGSPYRRPPGRICKSWDARIQQP